MPYLTDGGWSHIPESPKSESPEMTGKKIRHTIHFYKRLADGSKIVFRGVEYLVTKSYRLGAEAALNGTRLTSSHVDVMGGSRAQWRVGYQNQTDYQTGEASAACLLVDYRGDLKVLPPKLSDRERGSAAAEAALKEVDKKLEEAKAEVKAMSVEDVDAALLKEMEGAEKIKSQKLKKMKKELDGLRDEVRSKKPLPEFDHGEW